MSYAGKIHNIAQNIDPGMRLFGGKTDLAYDLFKPSTPAPPIQANPNDASNAALQQSDALRQRRGLLANIYAGSQTVGLGARLG